MTNKMAIRVLFYTQESPSYGNLKGAKYKNFNEEDRITFFKAGLR